MYSSHSLFSTSNLNLHDKSQRLSELYMNESSPSGLAASILPLRTLQEIVHNRIIQKKGEMHRSHNRAYTDNLWTEIETLQWVLAQILILLRQQQPKQNNNS